MEEEFEKLKMEQINNINNMVSELKKLFNDNSVSNEWKEQLRNYLIVYLQSEIKNMKKECEDELLDRETIEGIKEIQNITMKTIQEIQELRVK